MDSFHSQKMIKKMISWHSMDWGENANMVFMKGSILMMNGMDLEEELLQTEIII